MSAMVYLMYHELERCGRTPCRTELGYLRYLLSEADFRMQLRFLREEGFQGIGVSQALASREGEPSVCITFDDGCETDLLVAASILQEFKFGATFYVVSGFLGRPGHLSPSQLRELSRAGFEIGCHSRTHAFLPALGTQRMRQEMAVPKVELEQMLGRFVNHFSCPGGRWSRRVADVAQQVGYASVATSRTGANSPSCNPYRLARVAVQRDVTLPEFARICRGQGLLARRSRELVLGGAKLLLGDPLYERVRSTLLWRV